MNIISHIFSSEQYSRYVRQYLNYIQHCAVFFTFLSSVHNFRYFKQWAGFFSYMQLWVVFFSYFQQWSIYKLVSSILAIFMTRTTYSHFPSLSVISPRRLIKRSIHRPVSKIILTNQGDIHILNDKYTMNKYMLLYINSIKT